MTQDKARILIAEDSRPLANVMRFNLERAGFDVTVARDGAEAAQRIDVERFDLVLTDLQMPNMDGEQLCRHIRSNPDRSDLPIVVCSAKGLEVESTSFVIKYGISHMLYKPFSPVGLVNIVAITLRHATNTHANRPLARSPA